MNRSGLWHRHAGDLLDGLDVVGEEVVIGASAKLFVVHGGSVLIDVAV